MVTWSPLPALEEPLYIVHLIYFLEQQLLSCNFKLKPTTSKPSKSKSSNLAPIVAIVDLGP
jgi:hypothetical protein